MQKILFWVGYTARPWDGNTDTGLGGTEIAVINIARELIRYGNKVTVAGQVKNSGIIDGVEWIDIDSFQNKYSRFPDYFDVGVGVNYMHFQKYMIDANQKECWKVFWQHNTDYYMWYKGKDLGNPFIWKAGIDCYVGPSDFLMLQVMDTAIEDGLKPKGVLIPNGINLDEFKFNTQRDPNKFIWSSAVDRGLDQLLDHWPRIKEVLPEATLDVYYPEYSNPHNQDNGWFNMDGVLDKLQATKDLGVTDIGSVSQSDLHYAMQKATYWMYLTQYEETFCITALEMMAAGVLPICSDTAALGELVEDGIIIKQSDYETMYNTAIELLARVDRGLIEKATTFAKNRAKTYTWFRAGQIWQNLLKTRRIYGIK